MNDGWVCHIAHAFSLWVQALTRTVQLEPDNGEAWNNIGALNLKADNFKEAYIALQEVSQHPRKNHRSSRNVFVGCRVGRGLCADC